MSSMFFLLLGSTVLVCFLFVYIANKKPASQVQALFECLIICLLIICIGVLLQQWGIYFFEADPLPFENFIYIGTCLLPVAFFFVGLVNLETKIEFKKKYLWFFVIPAISLLMLYTNRWHHAFYENYSANLNEMVFGWYFYVHTLYTYGLLICSIVMMIRSAIKTSGFFSRQTLFIIVGSLIPLVVNGLGTFGIIPMSVYITPISFTFTILFFAFAMFKFNLLSVTPIAIQRIVDRMSDSFLVINENNVITDFNNTLLTTFNLPSGRVRNQSLIRFIENNHLENIDISSIQEVLEKCKTTRETILFKRDFEIAEKYFNIEISGIFSKNTFLGNLILLKDVTQHILDMKTIEENQSMLMEKERLASLGQMIGGIAHNLKTPIMSISGAAEGLSELTHEYDISIGDPEVTNEDHHEIVKDMDEWIKKIRGYTEYMSDVITAVKGQAVNFSDESGSSFTVGDAIKYTDVLMKHELKNALVDLNTHMDIDPSVAIQGNINSLVQVINNLISNAIQAYGGKTGQAIDFTISQEGNNVLFTVQDYGNGIPKKIQNKLFKEMITTKGKNGTGLGLFMSYSNIRAHFNGNMTFETEEGKGTKFVISITVE